MKVISSAELRNNMKKYLDMEMTETGIIQRGRTEKFVLSAQNHLPDDIERGITKDELMVGIRSGIRKIYSKKSK